MTVLDWLAGGALVTLVGIVSAVWLQGRQVRQALLGLEGKGGMMQELAAVRQEVSDLRERIAIMDRSLRDEITDSRHLLRDQLREEFRSEKAVLAKRLDVLDERLRLLEIERGRVTKEVRDG